jgi:hypothetical protein
LASQITGGAEADPVNCSLRIALTNAKRRNKLHFLAAKKSRKRN